jgi:hypothetical protein
VLPVAKKVKTNKKDVPDELFFASPLKWLLEVASGERKLSPADKSRGEKNG